MLLKRRAPGIETRPADATEGFAHLDPGAVAVIRCLTANAVDFILVGPVAEAVRGRAEARGGPVGVVVAPYGRNFARLERALAAAHARQRFDDALRAPASGLQRHWHVQDTAAAARAGPLSPLRRHHDRNGPDTHAR